VTAVYFLIEEIACNFSRYFYDMIYFIFRDILVLKGETHTAACIMTSVIEVVV
jgi:hypothetical protein